MFRNPLCNDVSTDPPSKPVEENNNELPLEFAGDKDSNEWIVMTGYSYFHENGKSINFSVSDKGYTSIEKRQEFVSCERKNGTIKNHRYFNGTIGDFRYAVIVKINLIFIRKFNSGYIPHFGRSGSETDPPNTSYKYYKEVGYTTDSDYVTNENALWKYNKTEAITYYLDYNKRFHRDGGSEYSEDLHEPPRIVRSYTKKELSERSELLGQSFFAREIYKVSFRHELSPSDLIILSDYSDSNYKLIDKGFDFYGLYYLYEKPTVKARKKTNIAAPLDYKESPPGPKPPPPPPPRKECCMSCCPDNSNLEPLLKLIIKKIGSADLPATVPKSLADRSKGNINIENLAQFTSYAVKQLDAVCGKYPIEVKIKDADLTEEGDQSQTVKIPNIAEGIAELLGLLLILKSESGATLSAAVRGMIEAGSAKQSAILAHDYAKANSEFLAYKGKQVKHQVPFAFDFNKQKLEEMLKEGTFDIKGFEIDDKNDLNDLFAPVLEMAAMYRAANFRNLGASNPGAVLKTILTGYINFNSDTEEAIGKPKQQRDKDEGVGKPEENWDDFLRSAEQGFIQEPGIKNNTEPYDRPFDQRPKIREIGNDTSDFED
ncbi:MAG: hypothetical protein KME60_07100 [Cyanomargarita calcarea GSE-NOS-MK-12-04C]|uniref:Uncharacterized protein n=1 Tax=Cyanomargarita calcarea GSE-NOS-MK-12-04C TaxID=2839659 RepID=A0A951QKR4_9CYAN|nr:hypothetical protein [Cyanomargarita calcarea GSE-NOS-MK-12-04C]